MAKSPKMVNPDLPQETLVEIFSYLPTKLIGKCRCLSKTWNTELSTSQFIKLHQKRKPYQQNLLLLTRNQPTHFVTLPVKNDVISSREIVQLGTQWVDVVGSCNGLVLLLGGYGYDDMFVVNPITRQCVPIPDVPFVKRKDKFVTNEYSFGYDNSCDDYKVVVLCIMMSDDYMSLTAYNIDVYCLKTRVWQSIDIGDGFDVCCMDFMAFVNGAVHWFIGYRGIRAFDLANETLCELYLPKGLDVEENSDGLVVLRGCLAIIDCFDNGSTDVWVMNEYGVTDSWVRFRINVDASLGREIMPLCFVGDEELLCRDDMRCWFVYDLKKGVKKEIVCGEMPGFTEWVVFEESLVAPDGSGMLEFKELG